MPKRRRTPPPPLPTGAHAEFLADGVSEVHRGLLEHVLANNARLSKVKIARLPHGIGIVASEAVRKNEEITFIPKPLLVNLHDIPFPNSSPLDHPTKVHSSLAAYVALKLHDGNQSQNADPFITILPPFSSFKSSMPLFWDDEVLQNCSPWVRSFVAKQREKLDKDYEHAVEMHINRGVEFTREEYEWGWAVVNTRTIYYRPKKWYRVPAEDCMTLCPFIDYYNHDADSAGSCVVSFSTDGLRVTTQKAYAPGEEIFVTYGDYNNDHLLVEYGFILPENRADNLNIDHWVLSKLPPRHQEVLKEMAFHGYAFTFSAGTMYSGSDLMSLDSEYVLDEKGVCYRTLMALRLAVLREDEIVGGRYADYGKLVAGEMEEDDYVRVYEEDERRVGELIEEVMGEMEEYGREKMEKLGKMIGGGEGKEVAMERWRQSLGIIARYRESKM